MRIAIATDGNRVAQHFGRCAEFTILDIENNQVIHRTVVPAPEHRPHIFPRFLNEKGVEQVVAGGIGRNAQALFERFGIETIIGVNDQIDRVVDLLLGDELESSENECNSGDHHHHHQHHGVK